jgi:hypothetical protein
MIEPVFAIPAVGAAHIQITATGDWSTASRLSGADDAERFLDGLPGGAADALGVELLWAGPPISFVGVRLDGERVRSLPALAHQLADSHDDPQAVLVAMTGGELGSIEVVQCGAINAWDSVPPMTLWDGTTWIDPATRLPAHPDLRICAHPVGLEVGHRHAWYAVEVSRRTGGEHVVDDARLDELADAIRARLR